jgi:hypothetical protein
MAYHWLKKRILYHAAYIQGHYRISAVRKYNKNFGLQSIKCVKYVKCKKAMFMTKHLLCRYLWVTILVLTIKIRVGYRLIGRLTCQTRPKFNTE